MLPLLVYEVFCACLQKLYSSSPALSLSLSLYARSLTLSLTQLFSLLFFRFSYLFKMRLSPMYRIELLFFVFRGSDSIPHVY